MTESSTDVHRDETIGGVHVVIDGAEDAPPLLLIHGSGGAGATWSQMVPALATNHRVITIDLPGCGRSPQAATYAVAEQASRVATVADQLGVRDLRVVGHSSGGYVATALAEQRPDLVGGLVLLSTGPSLDALLPEPAILRAVMAPPLGPLLWPLRNGAMIRRSLSATAAKPIEVSDQVVADLRRTPYRTFREIMAAYTEFVGERSVPERLVEVGKPLLVIFGDADPRWDPASAWEYDVVPGARVEYLAGVGHLGLLEDPVAVNRLLLVD